MFSPASISSFSQPFLKNLDSALRQQADPKSKDQQKIHQAHATANHPSEVSFVHAANTRMAVQSVSSQISRSTEIQIETKQGDKITIRTNQTANNQQNAFQITQKNKSFSVFDVTESSNSKFDIQLEGELNDDEQQALAKLMKNMIKVSDEFFGDDVESAFQHAQQVGFDSSQIAGFSMDLKMQESLQAVVAYQQTQITDQNINVDMLQQASQFLDQTKKLMADSQALLDSFIQPKQVFSDIFAMAGQLNAGFSEQEDNNSHTIPFLDMVKNIADDLFDR